MSLCCTTPGCADACETGCCGPLCCPHLCDAAGESYVDACECCPAWPEGEALLLQGPPDSLGPVVTDKRHPRYVLPGPSRHLLLGAGDLDSEAVGISFISRTPVVTLHLACYGILVLQVRRRGRVKLQLTFELEPDSPCSVAGAPHADAEHADAAAGAEDTSAEPAQAERDRETNLRRLIDVLELDGPEVEAARTLLSLDAAPLPRLLELLTATLGCPPHLQEALLASEAFDEQADDDEADGEAAPERTAARDALLAQKSLVTFATGGLLQVIRMTPAPDDDSRSARWLRAHQNRTRGYRALNAAGALLEGGAGLWLLDRAGGDLSSGAGVAGALLLASAAWSVVYVFPARRR